MKLGRLLLILFLLIASLATAQQNSGAVKLRGTRLTYPLVKKWITEFNKQYPLIKVSIAPNAPADSIDFSILSYALVPSDLDQDRAVVAVARYTQLPIVNSHRPDLAELQARGFTEADLNNLFFSQRSGSSNKLYVRDRPVCAVKAFSAHFGNDPKTIKGTGVKGDDQDLAEAVRNDVNGISFNNLGFIYDLTTRKVTYNLAIVPIDLNENGKIEDTENIYNTLDDVISFIEQTNHPKFVTERVNFMFNRNSSNVAAGIFAQWIFSEGQKFNHDRGFLTLHGEVLTDQIAIVTQTFKKSSASCDGASAVSAKRKINPPTSNTP